MLMVGRRLLDAPKCLVCEAEVAVRDELPGHIGDSEMLLVVLDRLEEVVFTALQEHRSSVR